MLCHWAEILKTIAFSIDLEIPKNIMAVLHVDKTIYSNQSSKIFSHKF